MTTTIERLQEQLDNSDDLSKLVSAKTSAGAVSVSGDFFVDPDKIGFLTYCPGGIDPTTGGCRNTGLVIPDPLGHLAAALLFDK